MNKYILGTKIIETTEKIYNARFKDLGYIPLEEKQSKNKKGKEVVEKKVILEDKQEQEEPSEI